MPLNDTEILLGNDFLWQFGSLKIDYDNNQKLTLGESPFITIYIEAVDEEGHEIRIQNEEMVEIPANSLMAISVILERAVHVSEQNKTFLTEPSRKLLLDRGD